MSNILQDWETFTILDFEDSLAAEMVLTHNLRGFDAVHLASALFLQEQLQQPLPFSTFDNRLRQAAMAENLPVLFPES